MPRYSCFFQLYICMCGHMLISGARILNAYIIFSSIILYSVLLAQNARAESQRDILSLSFEDLLQVKISSVAKREQSVEDAAASIYVITRESIRNSGATTLPEALRLDPRLQVSRITGTQYAVGIRGFTTDTNNKLLVMIDGRTVYTPLFSGVFWDHQDVLLEDIERIEVISGPGATLWGTNAVNGVINIITRDASASTGWFAAAHAGNFERGARARYGTEISDDAHFRVYGKFRETDAYRLGNGSNATDGSERWQTGFRADWKSDRDHLTLMGDAYRGRGDDRGELFNRLTGETIALGDIEPSGNHLLARWQRSFDDGSEVYIQTYWDEFKRKDAVLFQPESETFDVELQHTIPFARHRFLWGAGYRYSEDKVAPGPSLYFRPDSRSLEWTNLFGMGEIQITDTLELTLGIRLEHNAFTGMEYLPTLRASWKHSPNHLMWVALSRAVRAPSRYDRDTFLGIGPNGPWIISGGPDFISEVANAMAVGHRGRIGENISYSVTAYYHDWDRLRGASTAIPPIEFSNEIGGDAYGVEFWANWQVLNRWQMSLGGARLYKDLQLKPGSQDPVGVNNPTLANDAKYYGQIRSTLEINEDNIFQLSVRYSAGLDIHKTPSYTSLDAHYSWRFHPELKLSVTGQNLANDEHYEYGEIGLAVLGREAWLTLSWEP